MKKFFYILPILAALFVATACSDNEEAGEYDNWAERNQLYIDSIAALANSGTDGWSKLLGFNLDEARENASPDNNHYVYIKKLENGDGQTSPLFNDSVRVHYLGRLIPSTSYSQGYIFGKSYGSYTFSEPTDVPALMAVSENIDGFATALMHMVEGDSWKVVIPYYLGYGTDDNTTTSIPGYSALTFEVKLVHIYPYQIETNTTWH